MRMFPVFCLAMAAASLAGVCYAAEKVRVTIGSPDSINRMVQLQQQFSGYAPNDPIRVFYDKSQSPSLGDLIRKSCPQCGDVDPVPTGCEGDLRFNSLGAIDTRYTDLSLALNSVAANNRSELDSDKYRFSFSTSQYGTYAQIIIRDFDHEVDPLPDGCDDE